MKYDIILAGVGGQGVLSLAAIIATAASSENLYVRQSEVHGMAQRGGAVLSHLRISDKPVYSDLIAKGDADMILSMEPMESLRYIDYLKKDGIIVTSSNPYINIPDYPKLEVILERIMGFNNSIVDADLLAEESGNPRSSNMVIIGAASRYIPVDSNRVSDAISVLFNKKGSDIIKMNKIAYSLGREASSRNNSILAVR